MSNPWNDCDHATESVCELFCRDQSSEAGEYLRRHSESPLQVPFHYLGLIQRGKTLPIAARAVKPSAEQVALAYRAILQRSPENRAVVLHHIEACQDLRDLTASLLCSHEAVQRMPQLYARAFPSTRRLWHVHIPKTAGSSFFAAADECGWDYVNTNILAGATGDLERVAAAVRVSPGPESRAIVSGHWHLAEHLKCIGPFDQVIVFVRDPVEATISEFNYSVDLVNGRANVHPGNPQEFFDRGLDPKSFERTYARNFFVANLHCSFLADDATCASALHQLASCNAQLLPHDAVNEVASKLFPSVVQARVNVSHKYIRSTDIAACLREEILVRSSHDYLLSQIANIRYHASRHGGTGFACPWAQMQSAQISARAA